MSTTDLIVFLVVVGLRLIVPLFIFRFPLPAIVIALIVDAVDETVFQVFTGLNLDNYQSYDKALDIYYLALAYVSTLRNWSLVFAFSVSKFLWYYRLVGITIFELVGARWLLFVFPNTFEYFFIWYEGVRTKWNPLRLAASTVIIAAAVIWIFIKLPQEYWIHIAKLDTTDFFKESILGASLDDSWSTAIGNALWIIPVTIAIAVGAYFLIRYILGKLPTADWKLSFDADENADEYLKAEHIPVSERHWREGLIEKIVLVGLITVIFAYMLPGVDASFFQVMFGVGVILAANAFVSHWLATKGQTWRSVFTEFAGLSAINLVIAWLFIWLLPASAGTMNRGALIFFVMLLTLIVTCYDRYRPIHDMRVEAHRQKSATLPEAQG